MYIVTQSREHSGQSLTFIVGSVLVHGLRRWPNNDPTSGECVMYAGMSL